MQKALYILGQLTDVDVEWLIQAGRAREVVKGEVLIRQGVPLENLFIVLSGLFSVVNENIGQRELARLGPGEIVGEMSFVDASPPSATVASLEPGTVLSIPRQALQNKLASDTAFGSRFYRALAIFLSDRVRSMVRHLGYGEASGQPQQVGDELDFEVLENVHLAGARFERILQRLTSAV